MNQQKTLTVGNLNYVVEPSLVVSSTTLISLPKIYIPLPCEVYLPASARFQTFTWLRQIPCNHCFLRGIIQKRDVMSWWSPQPFQLNRRESGSGEQGTSGVCEWECHWLYCPLNIFRMTCDRKCLEKHRYCQKSWFKNGDELSIILLWDSAFCFGITSHPWTKHVFPLSSCCFEIKRCFFQRVFWQNMFDQTPTCKV